MKRVARPAILLFVALSFLLDLHPALAQTRAPASRRLPRSGFFPDEQPDRRQNRVEVRRPPVEQPQDSLTGPSLPDDDSTEQNKPAPPLRQRSAPRPISAAPSPISSDPVQVHISREFLRQLVSQPTDRLGDVNDVILGAQVQGRERTVADVGIELIPDNDRAHFVFLLDGKTASSTVGVTPQAAIFTEGRHEFLAQKEVIFEQGRFLVKRPAVDVNARNFNTSATTPLGDRRLLGRIASRFALSVAEQMRPAAEQEAALRLRQRVATEFSDSIDTKLSSLNDWLAANLDPQLRSWNAVTRSHSTPDELIISLQSPRPDPAQQILTPLATPTGRKLTLRIHESSIRRLISRLDLGLKKIPLDQLGRLSNQIAAGAFFESSPQVIPAAAESAAADSESPESEIPTDVTMILDRTSPLTIQFQDGELRAVIRSTFQIGEDTEIKSHDLAFALRPHLESGRVHLDPAGTQVKPVSSPEKPHAKSAENPYGISDEVLATVIEKQLQQFLKPATLKSQFDLPVDGQPNPIPLHISSITLDHGWLTISID